MLFIMMDFSTNRKMLGSSAKYQGFVQWWNESAPRKIDKHFAQDFVKIPMDKDVLPCGGHRGFGATCTSTSQGDYISVGVLLEAAGIDFGDKERAGGIALQLQVTYHNMGVADF